jgi:hypothetical protein
MIVVRSIFQARFGMAGQLAQAFKDAAPAMSRAMGGKWRVLTDLSGQFDTVVLEGQAPSLADWERNRQAMFQQPEFRESFSRTAQMIESGRSEFYTIEAEG